MTEPPDEPVFSVEDRLPGSHGRTGLLRTPHGDLRTPAFVPVGTAATVKALTPDQVGSTGAQAVLANAYHLYLRPGHDVVQQAGGLGTFMGWDGPTFTDSGGFQVMSLGAGFRKVLSMDPAAVAAADVVAARKDRLAHVDDDGVTFTSHLDGSRHRFTPEVSMRIQHALGADVTFCFDELTTLVDPYAYQEEALARTQAWAERCVAERARLRAEHPERPRQLLLGVVQGAQHEDLRRRAARDLAALDLDGFGIGGAIDKARMAEILGWVVEELPEDRPRHLLGIGEPDDLFAAIEAGADTFDCVGPSRTARSSRAYTRDGRENLLVAANRRAFRPIEDDCDCTTCARFTRAYLHHLFKAKEYLAATLLTIHNVRFVVRLVDEARAAIGDGTFEAVRAEALGRYYASTGA